MSLLTHCPACNQQDLTTFYEMDNIPVHSCLMLDTREEASEFPRDNLRLCFCNGCGFIFNACFDPVWSAYSPNYEDQQSFSPTFNSFAGGLAKDLVERYDLRKKKVIEIGCSKGDFLALLCEAGGNHGTGIDPSAVIGRVKSTASDNIEFIKEYYSEEHTNLPGDFICCRHTLEHIQPVWAFLSLIKQATERGASKTVMLEIPDMKRVLQLAAFEDIYYEHCSYFTPGTFERLLKATGFDIFDLKLVYEDQYLIAEVGKKSSQETKTFDIAEDLHQTRQLIEQFKSGYEKKREKWSQYFIDANEKNESIAVWGSGSKCVSFFSTLNITNEIDLVVDINPNRQGKFIPGIGVQIASPQKLKELKPDRLIIMNEIYEMEIRQQLSEYHLNTNIVTL